LFICYFESLFFSFDPLSLPVSDTDLGADHDGIAQLIINEALLQITQVIMCLR
jgi:hypothetical protein